MVKRILDLETSDIYRMNKEEKLTSIKAGEGRTIISEIICVAPPLLWDVSNVELAAAFGADILLLNMYDVNNPKIEGIPSRNSKEFIGGDIKKINWKNDRCKFRTSGFRRKHS